MFFQPTVKDFFIAHPFPFFLFWIPAMLYLGIPINRDWYSLEPGVQLTAAFIFCLWAIFTVIAVPKVWWHLYQKRKHKLAGIDPELRSQQRKRWAHIVLSLLAVCLFEYAAYFLNSHTASENAPQYMMAIGLAGSLSLLPFVLFYRSSRSWSSYLFLALLTLAGGAGMWQLSHPAELFDNYPELLELFVNNKQVSFYLVTTAMLCTFVPPLIVLVMLSLKAGSWLKVRGDKPIILTDKPFAVTWCLPIPRHSPDARAAVVPDYCQQLLRAGTRPPIKTYSTAEMSVLTSKPTGTQKPAA